MRRTGAILGALGGIALTVAAFLPFVTKEGGDIQTVGGTIPGSLRGIDTWVGWVVLGAGVLALIAALALLRPRSRIVAALMFLGGAVGAAAGVWVLVDSSGFFARISAAQVGEDTDQVLLMLKAFDQTVKVDTGPWIAAAGGGVAVLLGLAFVFAQKRSHEAGVEAPAMVPARLPAELETENSAQLSTEQEGRAEGEDEESAGHGEPGTAGDAMDTGGPGTSVPPAGSLSNEPPAVPQGPAESVEPRRPGAAEPEPIEDARSGRESREGLRPTPPDVEGWR